MDRVEFIKSIEDANISHADILTKFFDQYMILYDLIEHIDDIKFIDSDSTSTKFQLYFGNPNILNTLVERLKTQTMIMIYQKCYGIYYSDITSNTVNITITLM